MAQINLNADVLLVKKSQLDDVAHDDLVVQHEGVSCVVEIIVAGQSVRAKKTSKDAGFERGS